MLTHPPDDTSCPTRCPPPFTWGTTAFATFRESAGTLGLEDPAIVVLVPAPVALSPDEIRDHVTAVSACLGDRWVTAPPAAFGRYDSRRALAGRVRQETVTADRPVVVGFGQDRSTVYLAAALAHDVFDASAAALIGAALIDCPSGARRLADVTDQTAEEAATASRRAMASWHRALAAVGVSRLDALPATPAPSIYVRWSNGSTRLDEYAAAGSSDGLTVVLTLIGEVLHSHGAVMPQLVGVTASNRQYADLTNFAGIAAQVGPVLLDDVVTDPDRPAGDRQAALQRRLLTALRAARWCPDCLANELAHHGGHVRDLFAGILVVNDTRRVGVEFGDVLARIPVGDPVVVNEWPFHQGGAAFAVAADPGGDLILGLRSVPEPLAGLEPREFLRAVLTRLAKGP